MWNYISHSSEDTYLIGEFIGRLAGPGDLFCLNGDLGAGKTVFARGLAAGLGVKSRVTSPTFTLINEHQGRLPFYHMDVYRLDSSEEMYDLGYEEYFYGTGVTLVEWAGNVEDILPGERMDIKITRIGDNDRKMVFIPFGEKYLSLVEELRKFVPAGN